MPILPVLIVVFKSKDFPLLIKNLSLYFLIYEIILTAAEPFVYKFWVRYMTPAGESYSSYELHALYPQVGLMFLVVLFLAALLLFVLYHFILAIIKIKLVNKPKPKIEGIQSN